MKIELDKFVGRNQLPSDKLAFDRVNRAFAPRLPVPPSAPRKQPSQTVSRSAAPRKVA